MLYEPVEFEIVQRALELFREKYMSEPPSSRSEQKELYVMLCERSVLPKEEWQKHFSSEQLELSERFSTKIG